MFRQESAAGCRRPRKNSGVLGDRAARRREEKRGRPCCEAPGKNAQARLRHCFPRVWLTISMWKCRASDSSTDRTSQIEARGLNRSEQVRLWVRWRCLSSIWLEMLSASRSVFRVNSSRIATEKAVSSQLGMLPARPQDAGGKPPPMVAFSNSRRGRGQTWLLDRGPRRRSFRRGTLRGRGSRFGRASP